MPQNRYFFAGDLQKTREIVLRDEEFHYLCRVMRAKSGDKVEIINGQGQLATGHFVNASKIEAFVAIDEVTQLQKVPFSLQLALAFLKPAHLEYAIEKACEVGVDRFLLFPASRSEKKSISEQYFKRLSIIILSATKQCGRLFLPALDVKSSLSDCLDGCILFGDPESKVTFASLPLKNTVTLVIGPESGFTEHEINHLRKSGAEGVRFHPNTLRAETAAVVGVALLYDKLSIT